MTHTTYRYHTNTTATPTVLDHMIATAAAAAAAVSKSAVLVVYRC
jgi:hypothetical protein